MSTVYEIEQLINELGEEDYYNENVVDYESDVNEAVTISTDDLEPSHYKTLRKMIDFIKDANKKIEDLAVALTSVLSHLETRTSERDAVLSHLEKRTSERNELLSLLEKRTSEINELNEELEM